MHVGGCVTVSVPEQVVEQLGAAICVTVAVYVPATPTLIDWVVAVNPPGPVHEKEYRVAGNGNGFTVNT